jgi:hypothetical protein
MTSAPIQGDDVGLALRSRGIGVLVISIFGALWLLLGLLARQALSAVTGALLAGGLLGLVLLALALCRRAGALPRSEGDLERARQVGRTFGRVNALQWAAIVLTAVALGRLRLDAYTPAAVTLIVGLHFFPLGRLFRYPQHHTSRAEPWSRGRWPALPSYRGRPFSPPPPSERERSSGSRPR